MTSQIPYLEEYIGPPRVYTIDINDVTAVKNVLRRIRTSKVRLHCVDHFHSFIAILDFPLHYVFPYCDVFILASPIGAL